MTAHALAESKRPPVQPPPPTVIEDNANPLISAGDSLDKLIEMRVNDDLWKSMQAGLPCLDTSVSCIRQLQEKAIASSLTLKQMATAAKRDKETLSRQNLC